jgi:glutamine synthetase
LPYKIIEGKIEQQHFSTDDVMDKLEKDDIKFIDLQFTGLYGKFHHITISANILKKPILKMDYQKLMVLQFVDLLKFMNLI